jgi:hypothetical protein
MQQLAGLDDSPRNPPRGREFPTLRGACGRNICNVAIAQDDTTFQATRGHGSHRANVRLLGSHSGDSGALHDQCNEDAYYPARG